MDIGKKNKMADLDFVEMSGRTAPHRKRPSRPARYLVGLNPESVFDWGCGYGFDVEFLNRCGVRASGWDRVHSLKPFPNNMKHEFQWVLCSFVINTLPEPKDRLAVLNDIYDFMPEYGNLMLAVRSNKEVTRSAKRAAWTRYGDGWITSANTFQRGFSATEAIRLLDDKLFDDVQVISNRLPVVVTARKLVVGSS